MFLTIDQESFKGDDWKVEEEDEKSRPQMIESVFNGLISQRDFDLEVLECIRCSLDYANAENISNELLMNLNGDIFDHLNLVKKYNLVEFDSKHNFDYVNCSLASQCLESISDIIFAREESFFNEDVCWLGTKISFCTLTHEAGYCDDKLKITSNEPILLKGFGFGASYIKTNSLKITSFTIFMGEKIVFVDEKINPKLTEEPRLLIKHIFKESIILDSDVEYTLRYQIEGKTIYLLSETKNNFVYKDYTIQIANDSGGVWSIFLVFDKSK
jgi:hypothetical protein